jgi:hypothetical protein
MFSGLRGLSHACSPVDIRAQAPRIRCSGTRSSTSSASTRTSEEAVVPCNDEKSQTQALKR